MVKRNREIKKILVIKLCCVGDILFTTPAVRALRKGFPQAHLAYLVGGWSREVIEDNPNLDEIIIYDTPAHSANRWRALVRTLACLLDLRKRRFDLAVILHRTFFAGLFAWLAGIPRRIGFDYDGRGRLLTDKVPFDSNRHEVDRYLDITTSLGIELNSTSTEMEVDPGQQDFVLDLLKSHGLKPEDKLVAVLVGGGKNPGTTMPTKRWPPDRFARLTDIIMEKYKARVIFVGGPGDEEIVREVMSGMKNEPVDLVGKTTFKQLAAVLKLCTLFVGGDSGPLHIAAAVGTRTVGIFGPSDPRLVAPRGETHLAVWKEVPCSPCYRPDTVLEGQDFSSCPRGTLECMKEITLEDVLAAVRQQMRETGSQPTPAD